MTTDFHTSGNTACDFLLVNNANVHHNSHHFRVIAIIAFDTGTYI